MISARTLASIDQVWRAVQLTIIVPQSVNHLQAKRSTSWIKTMSQPNDQQKAMHDYKRMKTQKGVWRPVKTQSHSLAGKEKEKIDFHIGIGEREYSSVTNTKSGTMENENRENSDSNVPEMQTLNQDVESKSRVVHDVRLSSAPIKTFVSVKHVKSEASVECIKTNEKSVNMEPSTKADLKDASESEQQQAHVESEIDIEYLKANQGSVVIDLTTTANQRNSAEDLQQQSGEKGDVKILEYNKDIKESLETSRHSVNVKVDDSLLRFVKGKGGKAQKQIEEKTGVKLSFVSTHEKTTVVVDGPSAESVTTAAETIQQILDEAVKSPSLQYSHFISLPLAVHTDLVEKLMDFQNSVLALSGSAGQEESDSDRASNAESSEDDFEGEKIPVDLNVEDNTEHVKVEMLEISANNKISKTPGSISGIKSTHAHPADETSNKQEAVAVNLNVDGDNVHVKLDVKNIVQDVNAKSQTLYSRAKWGIDKSIFIKPATFHLTVLMLKLWNNERIAAAAEVLRNVSPQIKEALEGHSIAVSLKGLALMRGSPKKAHVLYARVEEVGSGDRLRRACQVIIDAFVEAGLVLEKDSRSPLKLHATLMNTTHRKMKKFQRNRRNVPFDARPILERYGHKDWGEYVISEAHLSQRFSYDENGYYICSASIPFPEIAREYAVETAEETSE